VINPTADDVLATIIDTFDQYLLPEIHDEYAASLALTVSQLLRSVRARVAHEGEALWEDNAELRALLSEVAPGLPEGTAASVAAAATVDRTLASTPSRTGTYWTTARLQAEAMDLRAALVEVIEALPDVDHPARAAIRGYLEANLRRQEPWLVAAFTGARR
jgi:hypothetical protein